MAQLTIKGHPTRGSEVIALLEMLGGLNEQEYDGTNSCLWYCIDGLNEITPFTHTFNLSNHAFFTLEEFLEKFPYKVGDKVIYENIKREITKMVWEEHTNTVAYKLDDKLYCNVIKELQPYKEETMEASEEFFNKYCVRCGSQRCTAEGEWLEGCKHYKEETMDKANKAVFDANAQCCDIMNHLIKEETMEENIKEKCDLINFNSHYIFNFADKVELILKDDWEVKNEDGRTYVVRKQPQYPKNLEECCKIIKTLPHTRNGVSGYASGKLWTLQKLLICRDAYWKIAGDWKPDVMYCDLYCIGYDGNVITWKMQGGCRFLVFPTEEMRDAFLNHLLKNVKSCYELI